MNQFSDLTLFTSISVVTAIRYLIFAGIAWLLGYVIFRDKWLHRKIVQKLPASKDVRREMAHSFRTIFIFAGVGLATIWAVRRGWTQLYHDIHAYPMWWFWLSIVITIFLHDTWFYWSHRLLHHRRLFRLFHRTHHLSTNPTPWAAFAFSPGEAVVQAAIFPLAVLLLPIHPFAFGLFLMWQMFFNVIGHTGYEYNSSRLMRSPLRYFINTPTNHAMHHESMQGNFGLYFNFWDRLMRTNHRDYEARFTEVTTRARAADAESETSQIKS
ncbi:MAG: sterol desaturase family protein [Verrucomicrobiales bacterium]